jgi:signal transduction histidine kinase
MLGPTEDALSMPEKTLRGEELETVHRNELRLLKLVNTLLDFSRLEAGRVTATYQSTDLCGYTMELASVFRSAMEKAGLAYVLDCKPLPQPVYVDREMWEKIVLNLISNALKSTFEGSITVSLRDQSDHAELMVSDTGTGIPQEELGHLFERFRRIENARRRTHEGSGIGLALVHELLILHGGSIAVQSQMEKGTTFTVSIPYGNRHLPHDHIRADEPAVLAGISREAFMQEALSWLPGHTNGSAQYTDPTELDAGAALSVPHTTDAKARVLVVDDNRDMREYVSRLLSSRFEVINAVNGRDALEIVQKRPFDLVLSDVMMPEMDGFQLLAALRENHATSSVPVVLLSARAGEDARIEGMHSGADDYLVKPFTARELIARVETHIKTARIRREAQKKESEALHAERARLVSLFRQAPAFLAVLRGPDHVFEMTNPQYQELIGGRHVLGKTLREALPEAAEQGFNDILDRVYQTGEPFVGNGIALRLARTPSQPFENRYLDFVYQPMREADNSISGIMVLGVDVTERKLAEEAVLQSEKLAAVGRLSASIAHEINNPLEAVTNLLYLIDQERDLPGPVRDFTRLAQQELARVTQIATQTLRFYRQSTGRNAVRVSELLDSVLKLYQGRLTSAGVRVVREYRAAKPLLCFEGELRQVFTNLIGNALDASRTGGQITVREREATDWRTGRKGVLVTVADTGHGMPRETLARIFEPFFSTKGITGTGLGLWVSLEIIQKHEGKIKARSSASPEHHGTVFSVFVPHRDKE